MATETGPAPNSIEELRGFLSEQYNTGEMLKTLLSGSISISKAATINSLWTAFEETNAAIVQHVHLKTDETYISSGYFDALKMKYESRMQEIAKLGVVISPKPKARTDGPTNPTDGTSSKDDNTPLRPKDAKGPTEQQEERLKELITRINIAKGELHKFIDRTEHLVTSTVLSPGIIKAKLIGLNRHWEDIASLHQKILRCPTQTGYLVDDTYLLEDRFDSCHAQLETLLDSTTDAQPNLPSGNAKSYVKEINMQMKILNKVLSHLKSISFQPQNQSFYELKLSEITELWNIIKQLNVQIWQATENTEECFGYTIDTFTDQGFQVEESISWLKESMRKFQKVHASDFIETEANINLPTIQIPKFDGNLRVWKDFRDLFKEIIEVRKIGYGSKLRYLKSYLSGEPLNLIKHLPSTDQGYSTAWTILTDRYDNDRALVNSLFNTMMTTPAVKSKGVNDLKRIHDTFKECYFAYNNIKGDVGEHTTEDFIHYLMWSKLDEETQLQYEQQLDDRTSLQRLSTLFTFMESRFVVLSSTAVAHPPRKSKTVLAVEVKENSGNCSICKSSKHTIFACPKFIQMTLDDRESAVKLNKLCYKCLKTGHRFLKCKVSCADCKGRHHALLHNESKRNNKTESVTTDNIQKVVTSNVALAASVRKNTLLPTAIVSVYNNEGNLVPCRALLDSGSTSNFITTSTMEKLGFEPTTSEFFITGIGNAETSSSKCVDIRIKSSINKYCTIINALVIDEITNYQPQESCDLNNVDIPEDIVLADRDFNEPRRVDLLLSTAVTFSVLKPGQIKLGENLFLQNTRLGWIIAGETYSTSDSSSSFCHIGVAPSYKAINDQLEKFWEIEHHDCATNTRTTEEVECENHFINTFSRNESGRYIVRIPFKCNLTPMSLGDS